MGAGRGGGGPGGVFPTKDSHSSSAPWGQTPCCARSCPCVGRATLEQGPVRQPGSPGLWPPAAKLHLAASASPGSSGAPERLPAHLPRAAARGQSRAIRSVPACLLRAEPRPFPLPPCWSGRGFRGARRDATIEAPPCAHANERCLRDRGAGLAVAPPPSPEVQSAERSRGSGWVSAGGGSSLRGGVGEGAPERVQSACIGPGRHAPPPRPGGGSGGGRAGAGMGGPCGASSRPREASSVPLGPRSLWREVGASTPLLDSSPSAVPGRPPPPISKQSQLFGGRGELEVPAAEMPTMAGAGGTHCRGTPCCPPLSCSWQQGPTPRPGSPPLPPSDDPCSPEKHGDCPAGGRVSGVPARGWAGCAHLGQR